MSEPLHVEVSELAAGHIRAAEAWWRSNRSKAPNARAINTIYRAGGLRPAVASGGLGSGVMFECIRRSVDYVLAGSIRDDGPLPDTVTQTIGVVTDVGLFLRQLASALVD